MEIYKSQETASEPKVELDPNNHTILLEGESRPEDVTSFYAPIMEWLEEYESFLKSAGKDQTEINCKFNLDYFNSASSKSILDIIEFLAAMQESISNCNIKVKWYFDPLDEDMKEAGEEFQMISQLTFTFHEV